MIVGSGTHQLQVVAEGSFGSEVISYPVAVSLETSNYQKNYRKLL